MVARDRSFTGTETGELIAAEIEVADRFEGEAIATTEGKGGVDRAEKVIVTMPRKVKDGMGLGCCVGELGGDCCKAGFGFGSAG